MKLYINLILIFSLFALACQAPKEEIPTDLEGMKTALKAKEAKLKTMEADILDLEQRIAALEPITEKQRRAVTTVQVEKSTFKSYTELQGNIESSEASMISAEMGGRLTSLTIEEGDYVRKGQAVGTVDVESIRKSIQEIETSLELATTVFERQKKLWDQQIGSEMQYLQAKNNKERLEKSLETIRLNIGKATIVSPMNGYVDMKFLKSGEMTAPGTPIASIINTSTVKAVVDVPENMIAQVRKGDKVTVIFPALGTEKEARINKVGRSIDPANRTFKVEINLSNSNGLLKPNLLVLTKVNDKTIKDAILLPVELVQQDVSGASFVYTIAEGDDGTYAQKNLVKTGEGYDGKIIIETGITEGDRIIEIGARGLAEEDLVEIKNDMK